MAFRSRLAGLAAAAALALPASVLIAALPGTAAQAANDCNDDTAAITLIDGSTIGQGYGTHTYNDRRPDTIIRKICAGPEVLVETQPYGLIGPIFPNQCQEGHPFFGIPLTISVLPF